MIIYLANQTGEIDSSYHTLVKHIQSKIPIVMVSGSESFVFNDELLKLDKYVLINFCEFGWNFSWQNGTPIFGHNAHLFQKFNSDEWKKFDDWVGHNPAVLTLQRELLKSDVTERLLAIEYPCLIDKWEMQTREEFNNRPINAFQYWGRSNEHRLRIHGEIWLHAYKKGFSVCDNVYYINEFLKQEKEEKWVSLNIPHWARLDINSLMPVNNLSKLSLSWPGAGFKCFRTSEAPVNSIMVQWKNNFAWTHSWNESNCILVEQGKEIEGIEEALKDEYLYEVYLEGMNNVDKYRLPNYIPYLEKLINEHV